MNHFAWSVLTAIPVFWAQRGGPDDFGPVPKNLNDLRPGDNSPGADASWAFMIVVGLVMLLVFSDSIRGWFQDQSRPRSQTK